MNHSNELETFGAAIHQHVKPLSFLHGFSFVEIDSELYSLVAPNFYVKFYCSRCHGFSFTVTVGPTFAPVWNTEDEIGFPFLARYVGKHRWSHKRHGNLQAFSQDIAELAALLPEYLELLQRSTPQFWQAFYRFAANECVRLP